MDIQVIAYQVEEAERERPVGLPEKLEGIYQKVFKILEEAVEHALEKCDEYRIVLVRIDNKTEVINIFDNEIYYDTEWFIKGRTYEMKNNTTFTWDGERTAESILKHQGYLIKWKRDKRD